MSEEKTNSIEIRAVENGWMARKNAGSDYYSGSTAGTYVFNDPRKLAMWVASQLEPNIEREVYPKSMEMTQGSAFAKAFPDSMPPVYPEIRHAIGGTPACPDMDPQIIC